MIHCLKGEVKFSDQDALCGLPIAFNKPQGSVLHLCTIVPQCASKECAVNQATARHQHRAEPFGPKYKAKFGAHTNRVNPRIHERNHFHAQLANLGHSPTSTMVHPQRLDPSNLGMTLVPYPKALTFAPWLTNRCCSAATMCKRHQGNHLARGAHNGRLDAGSTKTKR